MVKELKKTPLHAWHREHGGQMVEFGGWEMPISYKRGIIEEHLGTRKYGGLFDISHMGRFLISGKRAVPFLQHVLTNNVLALDPGMAQYTLIPNEKGGALDDAYLYRLDDEDSGPRSYLLVVNAAPREKDWNWLTEQKKRFGDVVIEDKTEEIGMMAFQGPTAKKVLEKILKLPDPWRNRLRVSQMDGTWVMVSRTGYTGEPICFEIFILKEKLEFLWQRILSEGQNEGIVPAGLGARDSLRLEAGLVLYGNELGLDKEGKEIPIYAMLPAARVTVSFSPLKGEFIGSEVLKGQFEEVNARENDYPLPPKGKRVVPRNIMPFLITGQGIARRGHEVFANDKPVGHVTSGTMVPYWVFSETGILGTVTDEKRMRPIGLAYVDANIEEGRKIEIQSRGKNVQGVIVEKNLSSEAPPYAHPLFVLQEPVKRRAGQSLKDLAAEIVSKAVQNTHWRQKESFNLIPSEQTPSLLVKLLSMTDPSGRYAEHRKFEAFEDREIFYYQGTKLIEEVERRVMEEFQNFLGCSEVETRVISGQMGNTAVFSGLMDYLNRFYRKSDPRRIRKVMNHHLTRGGHLSAQPMGALRDYVAVDPMMERAAVIELPVLEDDPYQIDLEETKDLIALHKPELIVLGKSMMIYREPLKELAQLISGMHPKPIILYDMAHVLGLAGPYYQEPFKDGADIVTSSTHKTFFGTQRGIIASNMAEGTEYEDLWKTILRRVFPGSVSNHHLGSLLGLLMAAYEMNAFKGEYQKAVVSNAKAFAKALKDRGLAVEGNPALGYTETHQVIVRIGYGNGPVMANRLEENNIIVNYQGAPDDEGFTAASCLRMGVQEMTRFGMKEGDFGELADYISQVVLRGRSVAKEVSQYRGRFTEMKYCLQAEEAGPLIEKLWGSIR
ncbi:MAG TPA: glycine cleavage system aminomethyltransferase GcvT [Thermodesulfobacteriota bacterium]|nr:glycine cleavage system aminomethyltransferase GcvT [Thermodesulfobacteriota bacterium]